MKNQGLFHVVARALRRPVPPDYPSVVAFGWVILLLFAVQIVTGSLLSFYYQASPEVAARSVEFIMRDVRWGWLIRGSHHWASVGMIFFGIAQVIRVLVTGSYRVRSANWYVGWVLMLAVLSFSFSGELLRWDQDAYWHVTRFLERLSTVPLLGHFSSLALRGGSEVGAATLSRIHATHVMILPWLTFFLVLLNLWLLSQTRQRKDAS